MRADELAEGSRNNRGGQRAAEPLKQVERHTQTDGPSWSLIPDTACPQLLTSSVLPVCFDPGSLRDLWCPFPGLGSNGPDEGCLEFNVHVTPLGAC